MKIEKDSTGNTFIKVGKNVRLTYVPAARRDPDKLWTNQDVIRINAYKGHGEAIFQGAEFPVGTPVEALEFIEAFCLLTRTKGEP